MNVNFFLAPTGALEEGILCVRVSVRDIMLKRAPKEFLKHSKESRGVLGQERAQGSKRDLKRAQERAQERAQDRAQERAQEGDLERALERAQEETQKRALEGAQEGA